MNTLKMTAWVVDDDLIYQNCGSVEFLRRIKEKAPEVPVIYTSCIESASLVSDALR